MNLLFCRPALALDYQSLAILGCYEVTPRVSYSLNYAVVNYVPPFVFKEVPDVTFVISTYLPFRFSPSAVSVEC
jgi:hypothetical protein